MPRPAVFLDRDGTVLRESSYLRSPETMRLLPGAAAAIRRLNRAGLAVVIATNQSGVARGLLSEADLEHIHQVLRERLRHRGAKLDGIYYCPHHSDPFGVAQGRPEPRSRGEADLPQYRRRCRCRKPSPGLLLRAARELDLDLARSFAVGDSARDLAAGRRAGCRTVLVRTGYGRETEAELGKSAVDHAADDLPAAVDWILNYTRARCQRP